MAELDLQAFKQDFDTNPLPAKRIMILELLKPLFGSGAIFQEVHDMLRDYPNAYGPPELEEIFRAIITGIYRSNQEKIQEAETRLRTMQRKLEISREKELQDRQKSNPEEELLAWLTLI